MDSAVDGRDADELAAVPKDEASYDQFQRTWTPYEGQLDNNLNAEALGKLLDEIGPSVVVTHSMGGTIGWRVPIRTKNVKAIVAFEPGGTPFLFPEGEVPEALSTAYAPVVAAAEAVPLKDFLALTKMPVILYYGDNIATAPSKEIGPDKWRSEMDMAKEFVDAVNRHGGDATLVHLPDIGIKGNTHFLMSDTNNRRSQTSWKNGWRKKGWRNEPARRRDAQQGGTERDFHSGAGICAALSKRKRRSENRGERAAAKPAGGFPA